MSLSHPVFPPANNGTTNLPAAFANLNTALRALDGADQLVIDAAATARDTVLSRVPQVLAVHGVPSSLDGSGRYVLRLPSNGAADQVLIVANRTAAPLRLTTADGANALVAELAAGELEVFVLSGSTVGAYALSSTRTGKANTAHTHPVGEITGLTLPPRTALFRASNATGVPSAAWRAVRFEATEHNDISGLALSDLGRTLTVPAGITRLRLSASLQFSSGSGTAFRAQFSKNAAGVDSPALFNGVGPWVSQNPYALTQTGWLPVAQGDLFRCLGWLTLTGGGSIIVGSETWLSVEAY